MVSNGESQHRITVRALCAARPALEDDRAHGTPAVRRVTRALARDVLEGLQWVEGSEARRAEAEAKPFASMMIDLVDEGVDDVESATSSVVMESPDHWQAFELEQEPLNSLVRILRLYGQLAPSGAEAALKGYAQAIGESVEDPGGLVPASLDAPPQPDPELVSAAYQLQVEVEYFGGPWPGDDRVIVANPPNLRELLFFREVGESSQPECRIHMTGGDWVFSASPPDADEDAFVHVCSGLGEALSAVPWQTIDRVEYGEVSAQSVRQMLVEFLEGRSGAWMPDFTVNGEPLVSESDRERLDRSIPVVALERFTADGQISRHEYFGPEALDELERAGLNVLRRGEATQFSVRLDPQDLLDHLTVDATGGDESAEGWTDPAVVADFVCQDEELTSGSESHLLLRWATVNDKRVIALVDGGVPGTVALWDEDAQAAVGTSVAYFSWWSDGGGAPISWDGGSEVSDLGSGWLQYRRWGDLGNEVSVTPGNVTPQDVAAQVLHLVAHEEATVAAALALEPLDPDGTLTAEALATWRNLIEELSMELTLSTDRQVNDLLRASLEGDPLFRACRQALAEPNGVLGQQLEAALEETTESGLIGELLSGNWAVGGS